MSQNTLMFDIGLQRAKNQYEEIYNEVMTLIDKAGSTIKLKVQLDKSSDVQEQLKELSIVKLKIQLDKASDVQNLLHQLSSLGDGTLLKPLLDRIDKLKTQLDVLGVDGSRSIERLKSEYNEATEAVNKYYRMVKQMEANVAGAKTPTLKQTFESTLKRYKEANDIEKLTDRQVQAQLNLSAANENVAKTAAAAAAALSNVGQGKGIAEVKEQVETLARGLNELITELKSIGNVGGVNNLEKKLTSADQKTTQIAEALAKAMNDLSNGKSGAAGKENELAMATRDANSALTVEKELAKETAIALNEAANAINAASIAAKSLTVVMGGNSSDVNKFLELATRMEALNAQTKVIMSNPNMTFNAKTEHLEKTKKDIEQVRSEMDELKKTATVGNPLVESFTTAFKSLNEALSSSSTLLKSASTSMGELNNSIGGVVSKSNMAANTGANVAAQKEEESAVKATNAAYQEKVARLKDVEDRLKVLEPLFEKVRKSQGKVAEQRAAYTDWLQKQRQEAEALKNSAKMSQKAMELMAGSTNPIADALGAGQKNMLKYAKALEKLNVLRDFGGADGVQGFEALKKKIKEIETLITSTKDKLAKGLFPPENVASQQHNLESLEYRLRLLKEIEQQTKSIIKNDKYSPRGYNMDEHLNLTNERNRLKAEIDELKKQGATANDGVVAANKREVESNKEVTSSARDVVAALKEKAQAQKQSEQASDTSGKTAKSAKDATTAINEEAEALRKIASEINVFKGSIESLIISIRSLVEQLQKMHTSTPQIIDNNALLAQAKVVEDLKQKMSFLLSEGLKIPKSSKSYDAVKEYGIVEKQYKDELAKFNEMLTHGSSAVGSYAQAIQQLGQKYNFTLEQASKLASLIGSGELKRGDVQRGLGIGYNRAGDIVETINALKQLKQVESQPTPAAQSVFDQSKFTGLQEAIDKVIKEVNRLQEAFTKLGENNSLSNLTNLTRSLEVTLSTLSNAFKFTANTEELSAYEAKIKSLQQTITQLEAKSNQLAASLNNASAGIKTQAEKKGSEDRLADNLQRLKTAISDVKSEFARLDEAYAQGKTMGMPMNEAIEKRLFLLRELIRFMQDYSEAAKKAGSAEADALSKSKAFSFLQFNGNQLFSKENTRIYSAKEIDGYVKMIEEFVKAEGRMAQTSGAATNTIVEIGTALGRAAERASQAGFSFSQTTAGIQNFAMNIETARLAYNKTLRSIADLENRISAGQKANLDKETLDFMNGLKQRAQQWADILKKILGEDLKGNPAYREFLSMSSSILTRPQTGNGLQALLGSDWKILLKDIGTTFGMLMKSSGFSKELTLDNATLANWIKGEEAVRRLDNALKDLNRQWAVTNQEAKTPDLTSKYEAQKRAIESLVAQIKGAMTDEARMSNRNGLTDLLGVGYKNAVGYDNTRLIQEMKAASNDAVRAEKEYQKEVDRFTEQSKKAYAQAEKEKEKAALERAKAVAQAEKEVQAEINKTNSLQKKVEQSITRGEAAKRDMSGLYSQNAALEQQLRLLDSLKNSLHRGNVDPSSDIVSKRIKDTQVLREDTELLRQSEEKLNAARERANKRNDNQAIKNLQDEEKSVRSAWNRYEELKKKISEVEALKSRAMELKMDTTGINQAISDLKMLQNIMKNIIDNGGRTTFSYGRANSGLLERDFWSSQGKSTNMLANKEVKEFNKELTETERQSKSADANIRKLGMAFNELKGFIQNNGGSEAMRKLQSDIQGAIQKMRKLMNAGDFSGASQVFERISGSIRQATQATREYERAQQQAVATTSMANTSLNHQSQIVSDLKMMAMQYLSVWGAQSFLNNIIELGGQLEQQRLSIGAILQDTAQANHLFGQIKDLAIKSPFGVQQLDAMTKQLSAYGFQYSELFEWTKRLADISAATGTSVDRLALALGHVRSEGALSGYTLRQFSMGNIPLLEKLSKNLSKTKSEIRKMTRNKEIGYEDVLDVLKQLTDEGGMFYNAQETMAQALNAKFKNLRDSFQIMYSEMAEGVPGDFLKGVATTLTDISKSWRVLMPMITSGAALFALWKGACFALNFQLERTGSLLTTNALASSKYTVSQLRAIATTGRFTLALQGLGRALLSVGKFLFSPWTLGFAAIEGLIYLWSKHNEEVRKAEELTKAYGEAAVESQKNLEKQLSSIKPYSKNMDDSALKTGIDSMIESVKNYSVNGQDIVNRILGKDSEGRIMSLAEKYEYLRNELELTIKTYKEIARVKDSFEYGIKSSDGGWFDDNVETDLTQYAEAYKKFIDDTTQYSSKYGNSIENAIKAAEKADPAFAKATQNLTSYGEKLAEFWSNPDKYKDAANVMGGLFGQGAGTDDASNLNESFFEYLNKKNEAMDELDQFMDDTEQRLKEKGYDFSKELAPEQVGALLQMSKEWIEKHPEWENIYGTIKEKLEGRWPIKIVPDASPIEEELPQWMIDFQKELDGTGITLKADMSMEQIIDAMKKGYDQAQTTINKLGPIALHAKLDIEGMSDEDIEEYNNPLSYKYNPELYDTLKDLKSARTKKSTIDNAAKKRGITLEGMKKDGSHKKEKKNQEAAKAVREQVRVIKESADAFNYWRERVGDDAAWAHVESEFGEVLKKIGITAKNIQDVRGHLKQIPKTKEYKAITDKKVKTEIDKEIAKEEDQFNRSDFEKHTEDFLSKAKIELDNLTRSWETFNSVREATGDINLAVRFSGAEYALGNAQNVADALRKKIESDFLAVGAVSIPFDAELSERDIKEQIENQFKQYEPTKNVGESDEDYNKRLLEYQSHIKSVVEEYTKWADLQRKVQDNAVSAYMKMIADSESLKTKVASINDEYRKQIENLTVLKNLGKISPEEYNNGVEHAQNTRDLGTLSLLTNEVDWGANDEFFGKIFRAAGKELEAQLNKFIGSREYASLDVTQQQQYLNIRDQLFKTGIVGSNPMNISTWKNLTDKTKAVQVAFKDLISSTLELKAAQEAEDNARKAAAEGKGTPAEQMLNDRLKKATDERVNAENLVVENQKKFKKANQEQQQASSAAAKGLNDFKTAIQGITSGSLSDLTLGIGNLVRSFSKGKDAVGSVSELLGAMPNGYGQIIAAVLQLLDMLKDKSAETIKSLLDSLFGAVTGIIKEALNGKLIEAIIESAVEGVGKIVSEVIANIPNMIGGGIFTGKGIIIGGVTGLIKGLGAGFGTAIENLLGFDANNSNEKEVREAIDRLTKENERLTTVIEEATRELKESNGMRAINAAKEARDAQSQKNTNIMSKWREAMGYHSAHHSNAYYWDLEGFTQNDVNAALRAYAKKTGNELKQINVDNWEEFMTLTPDEMDYIRKHAQGAWEDMTTEGYYDWVHDYLNEYADQAGKLGEIADELKSSLTLLTLDGLHDSFLNELMDMDKSARDFSNDFKKYLMKAILNAQIADLLDSQLKEWRDAMAKYMEEDGDNLSTTHIKKLQEMWDGIVAQGLKIRDQTARATGYTGDGTSSGLSSNIKNITEQTADLIASYVNAIRADVAVDRAMIAQYFPMFYQSLTSGNDSLKNIEENTAAIMRSNDAIKDSNQAILDRINGLKNGTWQVPVA